MSDPLPDMLEAARRAGQLLLTRRASPGRVEFESKGVNDFVTCVDREAEDVIAGFLQERWPGVPFLAEESADRRADGNERWIVDPLDGTTNYIHGYPAYAVSIAFQSRGRMTAGVVYDPTRDEMFTAAAGRGAALNGRPLAVSGIQEPSGALLATGFPFRHPDRLEQFVSVFRKLLRTTSGIRRNGSAALDLCAVAAGRVDGFWEFGLSPWDVAAGGLLVQEAGGRVTDFIGGEEWLEGREIVACTPALGDFLLQALAGG